MRNSDDNGTKRSLDLRSFLAVTGAVAAATITGALSVPTAAERNTQAHVSGRRKLGSLEARAWASACKT